jgi:hypothetical protein
MKKTVSPVAEAPAWEEELPVRVPPGSRSRAARSPQPPPRSSSGGNPALS